MTCDLVRHREEGSEIPEGAVVPEDANRERYLSAVLEFIAF
jgi:hypothetical protein